MTSTQFDNIMWLTADHLPDADRHRRLSSFAHELGWRPSDRLLEPLVQDIATAHLLVEHGLENTAVVSFLKRPRIFPEVSTDDVQRLLSLSYNNLVDWHVVVEQTAVNYVYVRTRVPTVVARDAIAQHRLDRIRSEVFEQIVERRPTPNVPALDDALIRTISEWKRTLAAELDYSIKNESIAALFNAVMFVRALEDQSCRLTGYRSPPLLLEAFDQSPQLGTALSRVFEKIVGRPAPADLINTRRVAFFDRLPPGTARCLLSDFYANKYAPYPYDFGVMSKHALSRIYEHYVSLLKQEETPQLSLLPVLPLEQINKATGTYYTPHFIARFFGRFLREQLPPTHFRALKAADPACGSGMFLRTLIELQADAMQQTLNPAFKDLFDRALGVDIDPNAVEATRLSLALLHLALTQAIPESLHVVHSDALQFEKDNPQLRGTLDAILMNPPFVSLDSQDSETRERLAEYLGEHAVGRRDLYLAFIMLSLNLLKPGGFGLFVLPHSFLLGASARNVRTSLASQAWVRALVDLSAVSVFGDTGIYVVLLIFQKKIEHAPAPPATVVRVSDQPGMALQAALDGQRMEGKGFSVYDVAQDQFSGPEWTLLPPSEENLRTKVRAHPSLSEFLEVKQGVVTGADDVFIVPRADVPLGEEGVFMPFLRDRELLAYATPSDSDQRLFFPFEKGRLLLEEELAHRYPKTFGRLLQNRAKLAARKSIRNYRKQWWEPMWPRPESITRRKLLAPHVVILPRFSVDLTGSYATSRGPILMVKDLGGNEADLLKYFCAVLNSSLCHWHVARHAHKYRGGYAMLEPALLRSTPVPDPTRRSPAEMRAVLRLVDTRLRADDESGPGIERRLDDLVADLYGVTRKERRVITLDD